MQMVNFSLVSTAEEQSTDFHCALGPRQSVGQKSSNTEGERKKMALLNRINKKNVPEIKAKNMIVFMPTSQFCNSTSLDI